MIMLQTLLKVKRLFVRAGFAGRAFQRPGHHGLAAFASGSEQTTVVRSWK
jgi:hypothetical protein